MGIVAKATSYKPTPPGTYRGRLTKVEEKDNDNGSFWAWSFRLIEDIEGEEVPEEFETFTATSSTAFTPKAKARKWASGMLGHLIEDDEDVDFDDDLVGKTYLLTIGLNENGKNTLDSVAPSKRSKAATNGASASPTSLTDRLKAARDALGWDDAKFKLWYGLNTSDNGQTRFTVLPEELKLELVEKLEAQVAPVEDMDKSDLPF